MIRLKRGKWRGDERSFIKRVGHACLASLYFFNFVHAFWKVGFKMKSLAEMMGEWEILKEKISSFPWVKYKQGTIYRIGNTHVDTRSPLNPDQTKRGAKRICYMNVAQGRDDRNKQIETDLNFITTAPQNYDLAMQALKEAVEILKFHADPFLHNKDCQNWLRKYGFEK